MLRIGFWCLVCLGLVGLLPAGQPLEPLDYPPLAQASGPTAPNDYFFLQRMYPARIFPLAAYEQALDWARRDEWRRSSPPGFGLFWVQRGPINVGARVNVVAVHPRNDSIIYAGFSSGGLYKTTNGGASWTPLLEDQRYLAIGAIAIDPTNPEIVYVGTGDPNISAYPFLGDGLYKTTDGGKSWKNMGLAEARIITKIAINPQEPNTVVVGAMGLPFVRNNQRGIYHSTNGGLTWRQTLLVANSAGVIDLVRHPRNPQILYAAAWDRIRSNQETIIAGPNGGVYQSVDGGLSWRRLTGGLPSGPTGRIGLAVDPQIPERIYAQYTGLDAQIDNIYRSDDRGASWRPIIRWDSTNLSRSVLGGMGWYFGKIAVNPNNSFELYLLGVDLWRSRDGGTFWEIAAPPWYLYLVHADKHALAFAPSGDLILGTDGGLYRNNPQGTADWEDLENLPNTQIYRVAVSPHQAGQIIGGAQDNGTLRSTSNNLVWDRILGGDGFQAVFDPFNPRVIWAQTQFGGIQVSTDNGFSFFSGKSGISPLDRTNWDAPLIYSRHTPNTLFAGTFRVYRNGNSPNANWQAISPDLTDGVVFGNNFHTISTVEESPLVPQLLYAGTTDANLWHSDDGVTWVRIDAGLPEHYVTAVRASPSRANTVYVSHSGYRNNEDIPHLHRSDDRGATWVPISSNLPPLAINDFLIIPNRRDSVIFVATDGGVYGTTNAGKEWHRLGQNMPFIAVYSLAFDPLRQELIAGTYGRSIQTYALSTLLGNRPTATTVVSAEKIGLKCFPVPAQKELWVSWKDDAAANDVAPVELRIFNTLGQLQWQQTFTTTAPGQQRLDLSSWPSGTYWVQLRVGQKTASKLVVKR